MHAVAAGFVRPLGRIPLFIGMNPVISLGDVADQLVQEFRRLLGVQQTVDAARGGASQRREQRLRTDSQLAQHQTHHRPGLLVSGGIGHQHAGQWTDLHRLFIITGRLDERIFGIGVKVLIRGLGAGVAHLGLTIVGMQAFPRTGRIIKPGVIDIFGDLALVNHMHLAQILLQDCSRREPHIAVGIGELAIAHVVANPASDRGPILVERRNRQQIGDVDLFDEVLRFFQKALDFDQLLGIERILGIGVDRNRHAPHQEGLRMRILAAQDGVNLDHVLLPLQSLQIMGGCHQVGFGRQMIGRVPPVGIGKGAETARGDKCLDLVLHRLEIGG